jgi:hypothetical protein
MFPELPRPHLSVHGEDVTVEVPGVVTVRAAFLSEGLFGDNGDGLPEEDDLYEIEVASGADDGQAPLSFPLLTPASSRRFPEADEAPAEFETALPVERFLTALAWELANAHPENWAELCQAARGWDRWRVEDTLARLPLGWVPEQDEEDGLDFPRSGDD